MSEHTRTDPRPSSSDPIATADEMSTAPAPSTNGHSLNGHPLDGYAAEVDGAGLDGAGEAPNGTGGGPERFIDPRDGLKARTLARAVDNRLTLATDTGGRIYRYSDGVWSHNGDRSITATVVDLLGERYRPAHAANVLSQVTARDPLFADDRVDTTYLNVPNGLLNWKTGELVAHTPNVASLNRIPVQWNPDADCPAVDAWLRQVLPADCIELAYEVIGYALYNGNPLQKAVLLHGKGSNGKGTFIRLMRALTGAVNCSAVTPQALDEHRFASQDLHGKLLNAAGDVDPKTFKATETFKAITGEDTIRAEAKYGQPFSFTCRALMVAAFNELPRTADTSEGFFRRWLVLPFSGYFPPGSADAGVENRLHTTRELQGLLARAVAGLQRVMTRGHFQTPASVQAATDDFKRRADPVRAFLAEGVTGNQQAWAPRAALYERYKAWAEENGFAVMASSTFYERAESAGQDVYGHPVKQAKVKGTRGFRGISLEAPVHDDDDSDPPPEDPGFDQGAEAPQASAHTGETTDTPDTPPDGATCRTCGVAMSYDDGSGYHPTCDPRAVTVPPEAGA